MALGAMLISCGNNKKPGADTGELMDIHDFIGLFQPLKLPIQLTDTLLTRPKKDPAAIAYKTFLQFVPDSVLSRHFGKGRPRILPLGKVSEKNNETYLFVKAVSAARKVAYVLCFDKSNKFVTSLPLMFSDGEQEISWSASMDGKYTISTVRQHRSSRGELLYRKSVYVFNDAGVFTLILMESNETNPRALQIINPIESLPHKHKLSGDYVQDKRNFISVRDGKSGSSFVFFVHFEKDNGDCKGELKGEAKLISPVLAHYKSSADPCSIQFSFSGNNTVVHMKELEGCGNHRDIKCFFEGDYTRQKEIKAKPARKKSNA
jgi:hypothetical protein